jgi:CHASE3 domain sensor protein
VKLTIGQKILLGYGVAVVFLVIMGTAAQWSTGRLLEANDWVRHTFLVIVDIEDMKASLLGIESDYRGYLFTGDQRFLELIEGLRNHMDDGQNAHGR